MTLEWAINRIRWRFFTSFRNIFINEKDISAISTILDFVEFKREEVLSKNSLFSKVYVAHLSYLVKHYNATLVSPIPLKELHSVLSRPLEYRVHELVQTLNTIEQNSLLASCGLKESLHPTSLPSAEKSEAISRLKSLIEIDSNRKKLFGQTWCFDNVQKAIMEQIKYVLDGEEV